MSGEFIGTGNIYKTDLFRLYHVVQNAQLTYPKDIIIAILRDVFSQDSYYHYVRDEWGFPLTPETTNLAPDAGISDSSTTRIYIGEWYRHGPIYYPSILVRSNGTRYVPISMNRNRETVLYESTIVTDGYGNIKRFAVPSHFVFVGAWEGDISIDLHTRGIQARDEIAEIATSIFTDWYFDEFVRAGILIKSISAGSASESDDRNEKLYKQTITLNIRTEWRRQIPVQNLVDAINICVDLGNLSTNPSVLAPNLIINTRINLLDAITNV